MSQAVVNQLLSQVQRSAQEGAASDRDLLARWVNGGDQAAFELIVWRHGQMVLNTCQRIVRDVQVAEDAFQATFITFTRKGHQISQGTSVGAWLHRVAVRIALKESVRRKARAMAPFVDWLSDSQGERDEIAARDLKRAIHEEIAQLPEKLRSAVVLCYLEGKTNALAARELNCPVGTIDSRLSAARQKLRQRLGQRGLGLGAAALTLHLAAEAQAAPGPSPLLVQQTMQQANAPVALGAGVLSTLISKYTLLAIGSILALGTLIGVAGNNRLPGAVERQETPKKEEPPPVAKKEEPKEVFKKGVPQGWVVECPAAKLLNYGLDYKTKLNGQSSYSLDLESDEPFHFAAVGQTLEIKNYRGKRVKFTGYYKIDKAQAGCGLTLIVTASDLMNIMASHYSAIAGDWKKVEFVFDVSEKAEGIWFAGVVHGRSKAWFDQLSLEIVDDKVATTVKPIKAQSNDYPFFKRPRNTAPENLDFEKGIQSVEIINPRSFTAPELKENELKWLKDSAVPLKTHLPGQETKDLEPFKKLIGERRMVLLGESTHGSREQFQMKHRLTEYLVKELGFTHFAIEANLPETNRVNEYVLEGKGDAKQVVAGMIFWTWNTQEVVDLVEWMREYNKTAKTKVQFVGVDMQTWNLGIPNTLSYLKNVDPDYRDQIAADYEGILKLDYNTFTKKKGDERKAIVKLGWDVVDHFKAKREAMVAKSSGKEYDRALEEARANAQALQNIDTPSAQGNYRDYCMAENLGRLIENGPPGTKVVAWAHNFHVCKLPNSQGGFLAKKWPKDVVAIGFATHRGDYTAVDSRRGLSAGNPLTTPPKSSVEHGLQTTGLSHAFLNLQLDPKNEASQWLAEPRPFRLIGALTLDDLTQFDSFKLTELFDAIVYIEKTTSSNCFNVKTEKK